jgi:uncharacterized membrane protein
VVGDVDWANLTVAGAFVVGVIAGTIATIRVLRYLLSYLRREQDDPRR